MARAKATPEPGEAGAKRGSRKASTKSTASAGKKAKPRKKNSAATSAAAPEVAPLEVATSSALVLPETLDSSSAGSIKDLFLTRRGSPLIVDAGQVRRTGMQALQILIAAARTWQADSQSYAVTNPSSELLATLALVGLSREHLHIEGHPV